MTTRELGKMYHISIQAINKKILKASSSHKNIIQIDNKYFVFTYTNGIGRGGKVLRIWSEPFKSEAEAEAFIHNQRIEAIVKVCKKEDKYNIKAISKEAEAFINAYRANGEISLKNAGSDECDNEILSPQSNDKAVAQHHNVLHHKESINTGTESSKAISNKVSESSLLATASVAKSVDFANNECNNEIAINNNSFNDKVIDVSATQDSPMAQHDRVKAEHDKGSVRNNTIIETSGARLQNDNKVENDKVKDSSATHHSATHYSALLRHNTSGVIQHDLLAGMTRWQGLTQDYQIFILCSFISKIAYFVYLFIFINGF
ncbi:hypothetical protein [Helicobacter muridarum]|uniref:hypothetical protein n=1 Tax=Helicobacter muridarum TaxID=216 RepID=UPI000CF1427C|nr:hypothetical protein [Helicobacter muridarum]